MAVFKFCSLFFNFKLGTPLKRRADLADTHGLASLLGPPVPVFLNLNILIHLNSRHIICRGLFSVPSFFASILLSAPIDTHCAPLDPGPHPRRCRCSNNHTSDPPAAGW